ERLEDVIEIRGEALLLRRLQPEAREGRDPPHLLARDGHDACPSARPTEAQRAWGVLDVRRLRRRGAAGTLPGPWPAGRAPAAGRRGGALAEAFLRTHHYAIVARNYRCRAGEIDLVALDGATVVFVEVRSRRGITFGTPLESVDARKQARVARVARQFVATHGWG